MSTLNAHRALEARIASFAVSAPLTDDAPILWLVTGQATGGGQNDYVEPESGYWLEVRFIAETADRVDSAGSQKSRSGTVRITAVMRQGERAGYETTLLAQQVEAHFPKGLPLYEGGSAIKIVRDTEVQSAFYDAGRIKRPVIVRWNSIG